MSLVNKVFDTLAKRYSKRNGGYVEFLSLDIDTEILKAIIELVDRDENAKGLNDKIRLKDQQDLEDKSKEISDYLIHKLNRKLRQKKFKS